MEVSGNYICILHNIVYTLLHIVVLSFLKLFYPLVPNDKDPVFYIIRSFANIAAKLHCICYCYDHCHKKQ